MANFKKYYQKILIIGLVNWPSLAAAQGVDTTGSTAGVTNPIAAGTFLELLTSILKVLVEIGTPILVIAIVWVGFLFIFARGNPTKLTTAKDAFVWTMIGAAVVIGAKAIAEVITNTVGNL